MKNKTIIAVVLASVLTTTLITSVTTKQILNNNEVSNEEVTEIATENYFNLDNDGNLTSEESYLELHIKNDYSYSVYKYNNREDYENKVNSELFTTIHNVDDTKFNINVEDVKRNDFSADKTVSSIITEKLVENHYMELGIHYAETEVTTVISGAESVLYFSIGVPEDETQVIATPMYSVVAGDRVVETRLIFEGFEEFELADSVAQPSRSIKFFASYEKKTDEPTILLVTNRTDEELGFTP